MLNVKDFTVRSVLKRIMAIVLLAVMTISVAPCFSLAETGTADEAAAKAAWYQSVTPVQQSTLTPPQKKAVKVVNTYMKAAKSYNWRKMNKCFKKKGKSYGYPTKKSYVKFFKKYNKNLNWKIISVTGGGKQIKVTVAVAQPDMYSIFYGSLYDLCYWLSDNMKASDRKIQKKYTKLLQKYRKSTPVGQTYRSVTFTMVKKGKNWKIKSKGMKVVDIATGLYNEAFEDAEDDFEDDYENDYEDDYVDDYDSSYEDSYY